jgi:hypothetical protein
VTTYSRRERAPSAFRPLTCMAAELRRRVPLLLQAAMASVAVVGQTAIGRGIRSLASDDGLQLGIPTGTVAMTIVTALLSVVVGMGIQAILDRLGLVVAGMLAALSFGATMAGVLGGWVLLFQLIGLYALLVTGYTATLAGLEFAAALRRAGWDRAGRNGATTLAALAVIIGGSKRAWRAKEFIADLHYGHSQDHSPSARELLKYALGLVQAAIKFRIRDVTRPGEKVLDWLIITPRSEFLVVIVTLLAATYYARDGRGWDGVMQNMENISAAAFIVGAPLLWWRNNSSGRNNTDKKD